MDTQEPKDISKVINSIVISTLLIVIIAITAVYLIFGVRGLLKAPEDISDSLPVPELSIEEKNLILNNLGESENPVSDKAALDALKKLNDSKVPELSPKEREDILKSL